MWRNGIIITASERPKFGVGSVEKASVGRCIWNSTIGNKRDIMSKVAQVIEKELQVDLYRPEFGMSN